MAQTIKHRRGKLERIKDITPISGELIIASGSDLSVHQTGLLFVGIDGNKLTPSNKILTGSATLDVTGGSFDHSERPRHEHGGRLLAGTYTKTHLTAALMGVHPWVARRR